MLAEHTSKGLLLASILGHPGLVLGHGLQQVRPSNLLASDQMLRASYGDVYFWSLPVLHALHVQVITACR